MCAKARESYGYNNVGKKNLIWPHIGSTNTTSLFATTKLFAVSPSLCWTLQLVTPRRSASPVGRRVEQVVFMSCWRRKHQWAFTLAGNNLTGSTNLETTLDTSKLNKPLIVSLLPQLCAHVKHTNINVSDAVCIGALTQSSRPGLSVGLPYII